MGTIHSSVMVHMQTLRKLRYHKGGEGLGAEWDLFIYLQLGRRECSTRVKEGGGPGDLLGTFHLSASWQT